MAHKHSVYDTDTHFIIDGVTRAVKNASSAKTTLVQHDHNSERFTIEIPRMVDGHDMSLCNVVQVHYLNIDNQTKEQKSGVYGVDDLQISPDGDDVVICSWLVSGNATQLVGNLSFIVRFMCVSDDGTVDYVWNTAVHSGVSVSTGIYNGDVIAEEYADIVAQWEARIQKCEDRAETAINTANGYQEQIDAINTAATFASQTSQKANAKASEANTKADEAHAKADEAYNHAVTNFLILRDEIGDIDNLETEDKSSLVAAINEAAKSGGSGSGTAGADGEDGFSPVATVEQTDDGAVISITDKNGTTTATITNGKDGVDGKDGVISVTGATAGQTVKITSVDASGVPTAWEAVDFPSGGGGDTWELLTRITVDEADSVNSISQLLHVPCKKVLVYYRSAGNKVTTAGNWKIKAGYNGVCVEKNFTTNASWTMHQALFEIANPVVLVDNEVKNSGTNGTNPATIATNGFNYVQITTVNSDAFFPESVTNDNQVFNILGVRM